MSEHSLSTHRCDASHFTLSMIIGKGRDETVTVALGQHKQTGKLVAVKKILVDGDDANLNLIQNEAILTRQLRHNNVLPTLATFVDNHEIWVLSPLMEYGSCHDLLSAHFTDGLPEPAVSYIIRDTLLALEYLHSKHIIHRGIQASHILISATGRVTLTGLRDAYCMVHNGVLLPKVHHFPINDTGKLPWLSPEILEQNLVGYGTKSDIYSIGITACELANGYAPFSEVAPTLMLLEKVRGVRPVLFDLSTVPELDEITTQTGNQTDSGLGGSVTNNQASIIRQRLFSKHFHNLVFLSLEKEPQKRPTASSLLSHSFVKNIRRDTTTLLPSLLQPVAPLNVSSSHLHPTIDTTQLSSQMDQVSLNEFWDFSDIDSGYLLTEHRTVDTGPCETDK